MKKYNVVSLCFVFLSYFIPGTVMGQRVDKNTAVQKLDRPTEIQCVPCQGRVHFYVNGDLSRQEEYHVFRRG